MVSMRLFASQRCTSLAMNSGPLSLRRKAGAPMPLDGPFQPGEHVGGPQGAFGPQHVTLAGMFIQNGEHLECAATHGGIADEVPRPDVPTMSRFGGQAGGDTSAYHPALGRRHAQAVGTAQALDVAFTHTPSFLA